jgi:hypothetical protein
MVVSEACDSDYIEEGKSDNEDHYIDDENERLPAHDVRIVTSKFKINKIHNQGFGSPKGSGMNQGGGSASPKNKKTRDFSPMTPSKASGRRMGNKDSAAFSGSSDNL